MNDYAALFRDRYGTALVADAAFRVGVDVSLPAPGLDPLDVRAKLAGPAVTVQANNDLVSILEAAHRADHGAVVVIANPPVEAGLMGDLIGTDAVRKGIAGFVVDGLVRDAVELIDMGLPVWCRGTYPVGPLKLPGATGRGTIGGTVSIGGANVEPGMWVFADADGIIVLRADQLVPVFERAAISWEREGALAGEIASGTPLAEAFDLDSFLSRRADDPEADFNAHLADLGRAI